MAQTLPDFDSECFFIAPIGHEEGDVRRRSDAVRDFVVRDALKPLGFAVLRADDVAQPGQITLQVVEHVLRAKAAVADLTGANPNVFYELAIRQTAQLPVVLIAEEDELPRLPFDILPMRVIGFRHNDLASAARARESIARHMEQALAGAVDSPIATATLLGSLTRGVDIERTLAEIVASVDALARSNKQLNSSVEKLIGTKRVSLRQHEVVRVGPDRWELRYETTDGRERIQLPVRPTRPEIRDLLAAAERRAAAWWSGEAVEDQAIAEEVAAAEDAVLARVMQRAPSTGASG
jgi:hypothetical protein